MRKIICFTIMTVVVITAFTGCTANTLLTSVVGQWELETITNIDEELFIVGKAYNNYDDFQGQKEDVSIIFKQDGVFELEGFEDNLQGSYAQDKKRSTKDAIAITMDFNSETTAEAVFGIRQYQDGTEVRSLILTYNDTIFSFINADDI